MSERRALTGDVCAEGSSAAVVDGEISGFGGVLESSRCDMHRSYRAPPRWLVFEGHCQTNGDVRETTDTLTECRPKRRARDDSSVPISETSWRHET